MSQATDLIDRRDGYANRSARTDENFREFEQRRLKFFAQHGFEGKSQWVVDQEGRETYLIGRGQSTCPTVLIHGGLSQASEWALLASRLPQDHLVIADRPGCGLSYRIDYSGVNYREAAAAWMLALLEGVGAEQADLVGNSMGGFFAMALATAHPDRVRRLVLAGAPAGLDRRLPFFVRLRGNPVLGPLIGKLKITDPEVLRKRVFAGLLVAHPERVPIEFLELALAAEALPGTDRAAYTMLRNVTTLRGWRKELSMRDAMARLSVPTLFAWGDADAFAPPDSGQELAPRMPDARVEVIPDSGHLPHVDRPGALADAITRFLTTETATGKRTSGTPDRGI